MRYVASVSFGKDSLAMLLKILELGMPLDEVIFMILAWNFKQSITLGIKLNRC